MTPLKKYLRKLAERFLGTYEEGEQAPKRLREQVIAFAEMYPKATRDEWVAFAAGFADECYEAGFIRGVEWVERDPEALDFPPGRSPEEIADAMDPTWRERPWSPNGELQGGAEVVPEVRHPDDVLREQAEALKARARRF